MGLRKESKEKIASKHRLRSSQDVGREDAEYVLRPDPMPGAFTGIVSVDLLNCVEKLMHFLFHFTGEITEAQRSSVASPKVPR